MIQENHILQFLKEQQPQIITKAPARINLINPLDAVEADAWAPAMAISSKENPLACYCYVKANPEINSTLIFYKIEEDTLNHEIEIETTINFNLRDLFDESDEHIDQNIVLGNLKYLF